MNHFYILYSYYDYFKERVGNRVGREVFIEKVKIKKCRGYPLNPLNVHLK
jgi:hypothetical protein